MSNEYPREDELKRIESWPIPNDVRGLLDFIRHLWWQPEWGFILKGKRKLKLELHTGGWSGNEDIIGALLKNILFWDLYWVQSIRGGHYYFEIYEIKGQHE